MRLFLVILLGVVTLHAQIPALGTNVATMPGCGPPTYGCTTQAQTNPGVITGLFSSRAPTGIVNTQNGANSPCTSNCVLWQSGDTFSSVPTGEGSITINNVSYSIGTVYSSTLMSLLSAPGTQSGVTFTAPTGCVGISAQATGSGCQNSTGYDMTVLSGGFHCYSRLTDGTALKNGATTVGPYSGGDNNIMTSALEDYVGTSDTGGFTSVYQVAPDANGCLKVTGPTGPAVIRVSGTFGFDQRPAFDNVFYAIQNNTQLDQYTISNINTLPTPVTLIDFATSCPGISPSGVGAINIPSADGQTFGFMVGAQNAAFWTVYYNRTNGCAAVNWTTGQWWAFCNGCNVSTPASGTFTTSGNICWGANVVGSTGGIHDAFMNTTGTYHFITLNGSWTEGLCAGNGNSNQFIAYQVGTGNNTWGDGESNNTYGALVSHASAGVSNVASPQFNSANYRPLSLLSNGFTNFGISRDSQDIHQSWIHPTGDDTFPWIGANDEVQTSELSGCATSAVYCPTWPSNMIVGQFPTLAASPWLNFGHTYACAAAGSTGVGYAECTSNIADYFGCGNAIGTVSPKGNYFIFASSMLQGMGVDKDGNPRCDLIAVQLR